MKVQSLRGINWNGFEKNNPNKLNKASWFQKYEEPQFKPAWYNDNDYYEYHQIKGHKTSNYMKLKNIIYDLIDHGKVNINQWSGPSRYNELGVHKNPMPDHGKGNNAGKLKNYNQVNHSYDNIVGHVQDDKHHISIVTIHR